jgi:Leucine-rich repeat (LRR) protein
MKSLKILNLENNKLGNEGFKHLAEGLKKLKRLKILNVSKNNLTDVCASSIYQIVVS